jgi:hypothetical protein
LDTKKKEKIMTIYEKELQNLKEWDEVQGTKDEYFGGKKYEFIFTAGHGYLVVPKADNYYAQALGLVGYGFKGNLAVYLEEDCEAPAFEEYVKKEELIYPLIMNLIHMNGIDETNQSEKEKDFLLGEYKKYQNYSVEKLQGMLVINC